VLKRTFLQDRQTSGNADPIVGPKGSSISPQVVSIQDRLDRVSAEIVLDVRVLLVDHIQMTLQGDPGCRLGTLSSGLSNDDVAGVIHTVFEIVALGRGDHILPDSFLVL
jgi:hypothetical protein